MLGGWLARAAALRRLAWRVYCRAQALAASRGRGSPGAHRPGRAGFVGRRVEIWQGPDLSGEGAAQPTGEARWAGDQGRPAVGGWAARAPSTY